MTLGTLCSLLSPCLQYDFGTGQWAMMLCGWEGNHRSDITRAMRYRLHWSNNLLAQQDEKPVYDRIEHGTSFKAVDKYGVGLTRSGRSMDGLNPSILLPDLVTPTPYLLGWGGWLGRGKGRGSLRCPWVLHLYLLIDVSACMYMYVEPLPEADKSDQWLGVSVTSQGTDGGRALVPTRICIVDLAADQCWIYKGAVTAHAGDIANPLLKTLEQLGGCL